MKKRFYVKLLLVLSLTLAMAMSSVLTASASIEAAIVGDVHYYYVFNDTGITLHGMTIHNDVRNINIPESLDGYTLTEIGDDEDLSIGIPCLNIESVSIPNSVKRISTKAFYECKKLEKVEIGNGVEFIGKFAFEQASIVRLHTQTPPQIDGAISHLGSKIYVDDDVYWDYYHSPWADYHTIENASRYTGTILSKGDIALVATISVIIIAAVVLLIVRRRKLHSAKQ